MTEYNIKSIRQEFKDKGIFYTPKELALFMKSFLPDDVKEIYDPTCGDGSLLNVFDDNVLKYGQDINSEQIEEAKKTLINFNGEAGDTLKEPRFLDKKFQYIIGNPPFSIKWEPETDDRFSVAPVLAPPSKADYAFILHILSKLTENGIAVVMNFPGILYRGAREGKIRQWLIEENYIEKVVRIGGDKFVDTKIETCLLVINKNKKNTDILFIDDKLKKDRKVTFKEVKDNDFNLSINGYIQEEIKKEIIDPILLQQQARRNFISNLEKELEFDKMVCEFEKISFNEFINDIEQVLCEHKR